MVTVASEEAKPIRADVSPAASELPTRIEFLHKHKPLGDFRSGFLPRRTVRGIIPARQDGTSLRSHEEEKRHPAAAEPEETSGQPQATSNQNLRELRPAVTAEQTALQPVPGLVQASMMQFVEHSVGFDRQQQSLPEPVRLPRAESLDPGYFPSNDWAKTVFPPALEHLPFPVAK